MQNSEKIECGDETNSQGIHNQVKQARFIVITHSLVIVNLTAEVIVVSVTCL